jgi:transposase
VDPANYSWRFVRFVKFVVSEKSWNHETTLNNTKNARSLRKPARSKGERVNAELNQLPHHFVSVRVT